MQRATDFRQNRIAEEGAALVYYVGSQVADMKTGNPIKELV